MASDEEQIRELVSEWMAATRRGDVDAVLDLMTDDAVFLVAGHAPMSKSDYATAARAQSAHGAPSIEGSSEIREIQVSGDWAFLWTRLTVVATHPDGGSIKRAGHTLTILRKENGRWRLARDANMLAPVE